MSKMFENGETIDERLDRIVDEYCEGEYLGGLRGYDLEWLVYNVGQLKKFKEQNKRYRATINVMRQILKDAIHSMDVCEKVQGLEFGVKMADEALEGEECLK